MVKETEKVVLVAERDKTLAELQKEKREQKTEWDTPKDNWEYVAIPQENALGEQHATMGINDKVFEAGKTYHVPPKTAHTLRERLKVYNRSCVRVLQPRRDYDAERAVSIGSANPGGTYTDPNTF